MKSVIVCIGKDGSRHLCYPDASETICNKPIASKKPGVNDWKRLTCIACDHADISDLHDL